MHFWLRSLYGLSGVFAFGQGLWVLIEFILGHFWLVWVRSGPNPFSANLRYAGIWTWLLVVWASHVTIFNQLGCLTFQYSRVKWDWQYFYRIGSFVLLAGSKSISLPSFERNRQIVIERSNIREFVMAFFIMVFPCIAIPWKDSKHLQTEYLWAHRKVTSI